MKKYLKILLIIIILAAIGAGIYYFFRTNQTAQKILTNVFPETAKTGEELRTGATEGGRLATLADEEIFDYWVNAKTGSVYYLNPTGQAFKLSNLGGELINSQTLPRLNKVSASNDGTYALAKFSYPNFPTFSIFSTVTNSWQPLPAGTIAAAWSPENPEIAFVDSQALRILNLASQKTTEVVKMSQQELGLHWRKDGKILIYANSGTATKVLLLNPKDKILVPFLEENDLIISWSKDDTLGLKLTSANQKPQLALIDGNGANLTQLTFLTMPEKCLLLENKIYCAVPKNIKEEGLRLPADYYKKAVYFSDALYLIDLTDGSVATILDPANPIDAEHLELNNNKLYFKNRLDDKLYSLEL